MPAHKHLHLSTCASTTSAETAPLLSGTNEPARPQRAAGKAAALRPLAATRKEAGGGGTAQQRRRNGAGTGFYAAKLVLFGLYISL